MNEDELNQKFQTRNKGVLSSEILEPYLEPFEKRKS